MITMLAPPGAPNPEALMKFYSESKPMNYAMVQDGIVVNVIEWDGTTPYTPPEGCELHAWEGLANIGWAWVDGAPVDPNPPPLSVETVVDPVKPSEGGPAVL